MQLGEGGCRAGSAKITMEHDDTSKERLDSLARAKWAELGGSAEGLKPAERLRIPSQPMPSQPADVRCKNMSEVALGYTETMARLEAARCLQCPAQPCVSGCPVELPIRDFVKAIAQGDFGGAIGMIKEKSLLPSVRPYAPEVHAEQCTLNALKDWEAVAMVALSVCRDWSAVPQVESCVSAFMEGVRCCWPASLTVLLTFACRHSDVF